MACRPTNGYPHTSTSPGIPCSHGHRRFEFHLQLGTHIALFGAFGLNDIVIVIIQLEIIIIIILNLLNLRKVCSLIIDAIKSIPNLYIIDLRATLEASS